MSAAALHAMPNYQKSTTGENARNLKTQYLP